MPSARATQTELFTLVRLDGARGTLDDLLAQTAPEQALTVPRIGSGARSQVGSMLASGNAKTRFELSRLVANTRFEGTTTMVLANDGPVQGEPRATMVLRVAIDLSGSAR